MLFRHFSMKSPALKAGTTTLRVGRSSSRLIPRAGAELSEDSFAYLDFCLKSRNPSIPPWRRCHRALRNCCALTAAHHRSPSFAQECPRRSIGNQRSGSERAEVPFVVPVDSNSIARSHYRRQGLRPCPCSVPHVVGVRSSSSVRVFFCFRWLDRPQTRQCFADTSTVRQAPTCLTCASLQFPPCAAEFGYTVLLSMLCTIDSSRPLDVEQNGLLPQSGLFETVDESREARLPAREVFIGTELDQATACATRISRRAAGFDLERIRHRRTI